MADDDGTPSGNDDPPETVTTDRETLKSIVREVLDEIPGFGDIDPAGGTGGDDDKDRPATLRDVEAATEAAVQKAMRFLEQNGKSKPRPKPKADEGNDGAAAHGGAGSGGGSSSKSEPPPAPPTRDYRVTLRKILVGD